MSVWILIIATKKNVPLQKIVSFKIVIEPI